jgi:hypothetical protein
MLGDFKMKIFKVTFEFHQKDTVTVEFVKEYFEKVAKEKVHNPVIVEVEVIQEFDEEKL